VDGRDEQGHDVVLSASGAGVSPSIAQGRQPPQRIAAIDAVMHEKTPNEGTHDSNPWFLPGSNASRRIRFPSGAAFDLLNAVYPKFSTILRTPQSRLDRLLNRGGHGPPPAVSDNQSI
jgi:hypothetical protein